MIKIDSNTKKTLIDLYTKKGIGLEGNITKLIDTEDDEDFKKYLKDCETKDGDKRRKRLEMTKKIQKQNEELVTLNQKNEKMMEDLQSTLKETEEQRVKIETQNEELIAWREENEKIQQDLQREMINSERARIQAEEAKTNAINDLDILQKRNQTELISTIVRVALYIIVGVGIITTGVYVFTLVMGKDTQVISAAWSNIFGILLTNAFSIVGTIMGIKYATENKQ
jgi:Fe2+ transport system protein B